VRVLKLPKSDTERTAPSRACLVGRSSPILRTVMNVQDFDGVGFHRVDHDVGERRERKFSCAFAVAGSAPIRRAVEGNEYTGDGPDGWFFKARVMRPNECALRLEYGFKAGVHIGHLCKLCLLLGGEMYFNSLTRQEGPRQCKLREGGSI
jgi:hypothetical protein